MLVIDARHAYVHDPCLFADSEASEEARQKANDAGWRRLL